MVTTTAKPFLIYHRGRHGVVGTRKIEENTLEAFKAVVMEGAPMIEFDVWTGLRVAHDPGENAKAPMLQDALDVIGGKSCVNLEIKSPKALKEAIIVVRNALRFENWSPDKIVISSFHHASAVLAKVLAPELRVGIIIDGVLEPVYLDWLQNQGVTNLHMEWMNVYMDRENHCRFRDYARKKGFNLWIWTVNDIEKFSVMKEYGADAVFTDRPDLFR